ncbi:PREDICTED: uncharacterized protein LOC104802187 isoform X2 [Tarenaya hassleriana]|uniref:uncharacterized protein LOC104802187 isoform X2 n=1 Tax=Tarenaya hassleriana TaxID=28532 RepID=UPI00053C4F83|nr:PREDICTED: uncharacterized protein LOC104802187 isoform X2 [Tarenaya hassleriana]
MEIPNLKRNLQTCELQQISGASGSVVRMADPEKCYYSVLGVRKKASSSEIRDAYRKQALKWHPDRRLKDPTEAKRKFQHIQEAYSVLSDKGKRSIYDAGMINFIGEDDDEGFLDFMQELMVMMDSTRQQATNSVEDLQRLLKEMMTEEEKMAYGLSSSDISPSNSTKKTRLVPF